jgi:hypothetical protein
VQAFNAASTGCGSGPASSLEVVADVSTPAIAAAAKTAAIDFIMTNPCFSFLADCQTRGAGPMTLCLPSQKSGFDWSRGKSL